MTDTTDNPAELLEAGYGEFPAIGNAQWYAIFACGSGMAFRFGPFDGPAIGKIMTQALAEKIPALYTADCGPEIDWTTARAAAETTQSMLQSVDRTLLLTVARILRVRLPDMSPAYQADDLAALNEALRPFDPTPGEPQNDKQPEP